MVQRKLYIPFTLVSLVICILAFYSLLSRVHEPERPPPANPLEFEHIIHHDMDNALTTEQLSELKTFFPAIFSTTDAPSYPFALLFLSGSDPCSNCFNEMADYLNLAAATPPFMDNHHSILLFHGNEKSQARRYVEASGMANRIDSNAFIETNHLENFDYGQLISQYGSQNLLYLLDLDNNRIFHGFVLPAGSTTAWHQKEIAFTDAMPP